MIMTRAEWLTFLGFGSTVTDPQDGLMHMLANMAERAVKDYVGYAIEQATYTHLLPFSDRGHEVDNLARVYDVSGNRLVYGSHGAGQATKMLQVTELPLRSVTSLYEDESAYAGTASGAFPASTLLSEGTDFFPVYDESGLCRSGLIRRVNRSWPSTERTVKITYVAGYTAAELGPGGMAESLKMACLETLQTFWRRRGSEGGIESEKLGDYSVKYASTQGLPRSVKRRLGRFMRMGRFI